MTEIGHLVGWECCCIIQVMDYSPVLKAQQQHSAALNDKLGECIFPTFKAPAHEAKMFCVNLLVSTIWSIYLGNGKGKYLFHEGD